ncbi:twin-arginine translocase TatA/TatE family subunit [Isoptericola sp. b441]|uniref:Sec-independent protein translocase protein TatA n=1 Tax=Actinotalea lenta TaxID=3064654 RepID=A0ABT9DB71_9CELL|nr:MULTISPECIES: twin-arginine translocase TatA/TatE family subunit [unclassified Isoptericola]MDO8107751.1 twin-arginine translocase TatA/TatE family subunit [Isoptericola sp. b441]MDO8120578.1 twin-arginine translocase TatA/TatE family subunit [Isoptericola sp. b490]
MGGLRGQEWLVLALIVLLLFGASRLPALARSLGKSARIMRDELRGDGAQDGSAEDSATRGQDGSTVSRSSTGARGTDDATVIRHPDDDGDRPRS